MTPSVRTSHLPGFTLLELMIALAVTAVLAISVLPALTHARAAANAGVARAAITTTLLDSLRRANVKGVQVVVCPSDDGRTCSDTIDWSGGWISFTDSDGDKLPGAGDTLLQRTPALDGEVMLHSTTGRTRLTFQPGGSSEGSNVTFTLCDRRGEARAVALLLANSGRVRTAAVESARASRCVDALRG